MTLYIATENSMYKGLSRLLKDLRARHRSRRNDSRIDLELVAVCGGGVFARGRDSGGLDQRYDAPAEAAAGHSRAVDAFDRRGFVSEEVQLRAAHLVVIAKRRV